VEGFHYHSKFFNSCFSKDNCRIGFMYELTNLLFCVICLGFFYDKINAKFPRKDYYFITNLMCFFLGQSWFQIKLSFGIIYSLIISFQNLCVWIICLGYNTTYYMLFRTNKTKNHFIEMKNKMYHFTVDTNRYSLYKAICNVFRNF